MGDRVVYCARLESVCAERHRGFESPPIRVDLLALVLLYSLRESARRFTTCSSCRNLTTLPCGQNTAKIYAGINHAIAADNRAGIDHCVAADLRSIANDRAEFSEARRNVAIGALHRDFAVIELYVGENHARAQMRVMTKNRITHVIEMRHLCFIEQDAVFEFARVAHDYAVADDDVFAHVTAAANVAVFADPRRALSTPRPAQRPFLCQ